MKAVRIHKFGGGQELIYEDVCLPRSGEDEVLVKVYATADKLNEIVWIWKNQNITLPIILET